MTWRGRERGAEEERKKHKISNNFKSKYVPLYWIITVSQSLGLLNQLRALWIADFTPTATTVTHIAQHTWPSWFVPIGNSLHGVLLNILLSLFFYWIHFDKYVFISGLLYVLSIALNIKLHWNPINSSCVVS